MPKEISGNLSGKGLKVGIVVSRFNDFITSRLLAGALDSLDRCGVSLEDVHIVRVPGSFEIPLAAKTMAAGRKYNAIICLGAVIRGATPHFDYIASEVTKGIAQSSLDSGIPLVYGVLTTDTLEQAIERAGAKVGNKGWDAALHAIEMANLLKALA